MTYDLNITFDDNLVTGNETIDTQHKELMFSYLELFHLLQLLFQAFFLSLHRY